LEVPTLDESTQAALSSRFEWIGSTDNPVHLPATASGEDYRRAVDILAQGGIDSLIVVHAARLGGDPDDVVSGLAASMAARSRPVVSVCLGRETQVGRPWFAFPEEAARALAHVVRYSEWRAREDGRVRSFDDADPERAAELVRERLKRGVAWLDPESAHNLLKAYGIPLAGLRQSSSTAEVVATERLRATDPSRQREEPAYEMLIGVLHDPAFGPVIACGTGGALLEVVGDVSVRVAPLTDVDVHEMVRSLQSFQLLDGKRGAPRVAVEALEEILTRVSALVESHPEVAEMDLNPVLVTSDGATVLDARVRLEAPRPALPLSARRS
jgi:acyl-CoA synthetase (NDP forming)